MTEIRVGDRVKVEIEATVTISNGGNPWIEIKTDDGERVQVERKNATRLSVTLPAKIGTVIRYEDKDVSNDLNTRILLKKGWYTLGGTLIDTDSIQKVADAQGFTVLSKGWD